MFKKQIEELLVKEESVASEIESLESMLKSKKFEHRDIRAGVSALTRLQEKYSEEVNEECSISV